MGWREIFESDGDRAKRLFREEVAAHAERMEKFRAEAKAAGFTEGQTEFMAKFLSLSDHSHQYRFSMHYRLSSPPADGRWKDMED